VDDRLALALKYRNSNLLNDAWTVLSEMVAEPDPSLDVLRVAIDVRLESTGFEEVIALCDRALVLATEAPIRAEIMLRKAQAFFALGRLQQTDEVLAQALAAQPTRHHIHFTIGLLRHYTGRNTEAEAAYRAAIALQNPYPAAWNNLGNVLDDLGRPAEARDAFAMAIKQSPSFSMAHNNLGASLAGQGHYAAAADAHKQALELDPRNVAARINLGVALLEQGRISPAITAFDAALTAAPKNRDAADNWLYSRIYSQEDPEVIYGDHAAWGQMSPTVEPAPVHEPDPERRLRVGYVSPDFRQHSVNYFFEPLLNAHDPKAVEVFCYADVTHGDAVTARLKARADHWRDIRGRSVSDVHDLVRADRIDVLVDLAGHTKGNRLPVFVHRAAPVQVTALGYPATTGIEAMDYRLCDEITDPSPAADAFATETLIRLPTGMHCYGPPADAPASSPLPALAAGHVTFGSFNKLAKVSTATVSLWAKAMKAVPGSRLILKSKALAEAETRAHVTGLFKAQGITANRLDLMGWIAGDRDHLALYGKIDVALDTFPYNGTTTTCEALWMGVPVLSLAGKGHASRVGASLLSQVGLKDWIADTSEDFTARAVRLTKDVNALATLRENLRATMAASPLCDAKAHARSVESAYRDMWRKACAR